MCGLLGCIGNPDLSDDARLKRARVLEALFVANVSRGDDATGVAVYTHGDPTITKKAVDAYAFLLLPEARTALRTREASLLMGHTRMGTHGKNIDRNAHPFKERSVVGAHNGMIGNFKALEQGPSAWKKPSEVDSQNVFRMLSLASAYSPEEGFSAAYKQLLGKISGSLALTWTDNRDPGFIYMMAHENPLNIVVVPDVGAFWSSQLDHLAPVVQAVYGNSWGTFQLKDDTLYRIRWTGKTIEYQEWSVKFPKDFGYGQPHGWYNDYLTGNGAGKTDYTAWGCENCGAEKAAYLPEDDMTLCNPCIRDYNQVKGGMTPDEFLGVYATDVTVERKAHS